MKSNTMALYNNFDEAGRVIDDLKAANLPGVSMEDVIIKSPIEHPEVSAKLGERPVRIQWFTLLGVLVGPITVVTGIASAQATFIYQVRGGRPVIPVPPDLVLMYEIFVLSAVFMTFISCMITITRKKNKSPLYHKAVSEDKIAILVKAEAQSIPQVNEIFKRHQPLEIIGDPV